MVELLLGVVVLFVMGLAAEFAVDVAKATWLSPFVTRRARVIWRVALLLLVVSLLVLVLQSVA